MNSGTERAADVLRQAREAVEIAAAKKIKLGYRDYERFKSWLLLIGLPSSEYQDCCQKLAKILHL